MPVTISKVLWEYSDAHLFSLVWKSYNRALGLTKPKTSANWSLTVRVCHPCNRKNTAARWSVSPNRISAHAIATAMLVINGSFRSYFLKSFPSAKLSTRQLDTQHQGKMVLFFPLPLSFSSAPALLGRHCPGMVRSGAEWQQQEPPCWPRLGWACSFLQLQGAIMVASCVQILVGFSGLIGFVMRFIGPLTIAPTISLVALPLFESTGEDVGIHWGISSL